jgi:hypothetical protein
VLYGTARAPDRHSAAALYSSDESYRYRYRYQQKAAMRHSANKGKDVARTKAFCDEHELGHLWPQFEKLGINTPADIAALSQLVVVRGLTHVKFNLEQGKVHRNQSFCRHLSSSAIGMVSMYGFIECYLPDIAGFNCLFLGPATWLAWPHLLNRVRIVPLHRTE